MYVSVYIDEQFLNITKCFKTKDDLQFTKGKVYSYTEVGKICLLQALRMV